MALRRVKFTGHRWILLLSLVIFTAETILCICYVQILQNEYYVTPQGDDRNPGTLEEPWRTIQKAANTMVAGDTVNILAGEYDERIQVTTSGESESPITYRAEGKVTMKGFSIQADYIAILGFEITDTEDSEIEGLGIFVDGSNCILMDNYIHFATRGGITLSASSSECEVKNNRLYRNAMAGIEVHGRDHLIEGNEIWGTIQYHPKWKNPPYWVDADGIRFFGLGHIIRKNYIHDITFDDPENINPHIDCFQSWADEYHSAASDVIIEQNLCKVLESQAINENGHGFMLANAHRLIIRNNIIQAFGGINTGGGGNSELVIVNNIFAGDLSFPINRYPTGISLWDCPNTVVKNNIFYNQAYDTISVSGDDSGQDIDYNLAYRDDGVPSECYEIDWECVNPAPVHHLWDVDPLFVDPSSGDFHLQEGSPAIDGGLALPEVSRDFDGNERPQGEGYDIGAFEYILSD